MIPRKWEFQFCPQAWLSLGFHFDHTDPSLTLHLPFMLVSFGRLKQPGFKGGDDVLVRQSERIGELEIQLNVMSKLHAIKCGVK